MLLLLLLAEPSICSPLYVMVSTANFEPTRTCCAVRGRVKPFGCPAHGEWTSCTAQQSNAVVCHATNCSQLTPSWCELTAVGEMTHRSIALLCKAPGTRRLCQSLHACCQWQSRAFELPNGVGYTAQQSKVTVYFMSPAATASHQRSGTQPHNSPIPCLNVTRTTAAATLLPMPHCMPTMQPAMHES